MAKRAEEAVIKGAKEIGKGTSKGAQHIWDLIKKIAGAGTGKKARIITIFVLIVLIAGCYFIFFYKYPCSSQECFLDALWKCKSVSYTSTGSDIWHYAILGKTLNECEVKVQSVTFTSDAQIGKAIEGKDMVCYIPNENSFMPESKIEYCHGLLKEEIQDQIIKKMHLYIVENIGEIKEVTRVI